MSRAVLYIARLPISQNQSFFFSQFSLPLQIDQKLSAYNKATMN